MADLINIVENDELLSKYIPDDIRPKQITRSFIMKILFNIKPKKYEMLLKKQKKIKDRKVKKKKTTKIVKISKPVYDSLFDLNSKSSGKSNPKTNNLKINNDKENPQDVNNLIFDVNQNSFDTLFNNNIYSPINNII